VRAPQGVYACTGMDNWVAISCGNDEEFAGLCRTMGRVELASDDRYSDAASRRFNHDQLDSEIAAWTQTMEQYEAFHALQANGVTASPVLRLSQVYEDPHLRSRDMWQDVAHPISGTHPYLRPPISHMSETPLWYWRPAPTLGQDNEYVYKDLLGYGDTDYQELLEKGYIGTTFAGR
jgi:crotonobetainyl-CoA:carnitine CoA-transferase CaiB-like acyl-CoA transferase